jgi:plasmid stability protein
MRTTLDLPKSLARALKLRAVREGRRMNEVAIDALTAGLAGAEGTRRKSAIVAKDKKTGLPVIRCRLSKSMTPRKVADILISQECAWANDFGRRE